MSTASKAPRKATKKVEEESKVAAPAATPVAATAAAGESKRKQKSKAPAAAAAAVAPSTEAPVATEVAGESKSGSPESLDSVDRLIKAWSEHKAATSKAADEHVKALRSLKRQFKADLESARKKRRSKKEKDPNAPKRENSANTQRVRLSEALAKFLGKAKDTVMQRGEVHTAVRNYIVSQNLSKPENKRVVLPDASLSTVLGPMRKEHEEKEGFTLFNVNSYLEPHLVKLPREPAPAASA
jgi:chromatin remodeling complex protein RSC6